MQPGVPSILPESSQRNFKTQRDGIRVRQLHLVQIAARTQNAQIGNHPAARTDQRDCFLRRKLSFLIQPLVNGCS